MSQARPHLRILAGEALLLTTLMLALAGAGVFWRAQLLLAPALCLLPWTLSLWACALAERRRAQTLPADGAERLDPLVLWLLLSGAVSGSAAIAMILWAPTQALPVPLLPIGVGLLLVAGLSGVAAAYHSDTKELPEAPGLGGWARWGLWSLGLVGLALIGTALSGSALSGSALSGSALSGSALSGSALSGSALGSALSGSALGSALGAPESLEPDTLVRLQTGLVNALAVATIGLSLELLIAGLRRPLLLPAPKQLGWYPGAAPLSLRLLGSSLNPFTSFFDTLQSLSGIDLKGTWAIAVLRRSIEPLAVGVLALGWLSTGVVMVDMHETGVRERFGVPQAQLLAPGLHLSIPWPVDRVQRLPTARIQTMKLGHGEAPQASAAQPFSWLFSLGYSGETEAEEERESRLWAKQHAAEEYTLLLGDGRDLVSVDGLLHYQIVDPHAWLYGAQNPEQALRSAAYRALMVHTADKSLDGVLSENLQRLSEQIRETIQSSIAQQDLGVEIVSFTLSALHPPVLVATDYQSVVSAQIDQQRMITQAQGYRLGRLPLARTEAAVAVSQASADAATRLAHARGEAAAFTAVQSAYQASPSLFRYRRRMEVLEDKLKGRRLYVLDARFEADGGNVWLME